MRAQPQTLKDLILESQTSEELSADEVLYRFVSSAHPPYEIQGCEEEALCLLINFSAKRKSVKEPLSFDEAEDHLMEKKGILIKRYAQALPGKHTHNIKALRSYHQGVIRYELPYDSQTPYVHSGSVKLSIRNGYSGNAAYTKAAKALQAEFFYNGQLTSMLEEVQSNSKLGQRFMSLLQDVYERLQEETDDEDEEEKENYLETLESAIKEMKAETFPEKATDPQIHAITRPGDTNVLLSPEPHTGLQLEIHLRLKEAKPWMHLWMKTGTSGQEINTYGSLLADTGGWLRVFRSLPPREMPRSEFRTLIDHLGVMGHLYCFDYVSGFFKKFFSAYIDDETGEQRRLVTFAQNQVLEKVCDKMVKSLFRHYRKLRFFLSLGWSIPKWCQPALESSAAQSYLLIKGTNSSKAIKTITDELLPLIKEIVNSDMQHQHFPYTHHHENFIRNAISSHLRTT